MRRRRRINGDGTVSGPRKDGRYVGAFHAPTTAGTRKRIYVYGRTWQGAREKLLEEQAKVQQGIPVAARSWKLGEYLDYWLENVVKPTKRPATYALYEINVRVPSQTRARQTPIEAPLGSPRAGVPERQAP